MIQALSNQLLQISELYRRLFANDDACIIRGPNFLPLSLIRKMKQFNVLHGDEPTEPLREWNRQPPEFHFEYKTSPSKTSSVVLAIIGRIHYHYVNNSYIEV